MQKTLLFALSVFVLSGCASTVVFTSDIEGATVSTKSGQVYGLSPVAVEFDDETLNASRSKDGCARIPRVTYQWPSGATASSPDPIVLCGGGRQFTVQVDRPKDTPGTETDLRFALEQQKLREAALRRELELERMYNDQHFMWRMMSPLYAYPRTTVP